MNYHRVVVKLGTNVLTAGGPKLSRPRLVDLVRQLARLHGAGLDVVVVSSGAVLAGRERLNLYERVKGIPLKQMLAAVGQGRLMQLYHQLFDLYDIPVAQALLTRADLADRTRYLNARNTLLALLERRVIPIVNENDVVGVEEIRIGDNDNLSALVSNLIDADLLVMLTDAAGLFTADPRKVPDAVLIPEVLHIDDRVRAMAGGVGTGRGTGGMLTKIQAADLATQTGTTTIIAAGAEPEVLTRLAAGEALGTRFAAQKPGVESRKRWMMAEPARGVVVVDDGAVTALRERGKSLLPAGVVQVQGDFSRGALLRVCDREGHDIARGLANYAAGDLRTIMSLQSGDIEARLGYDYGGAAIHRNNLVLLS
ncbi:MAG: glutamate 5-kinase [Anaerolineae bacterium]|nr:glutamate 5-kinase [Anaerolineae bacterium]